jgi:hypothetical protein
MQACAGLDIGDWLWAIHAKQANQVSWWRARRSWPVWVRHSIDNRILWSKEISSRSRFRITKYADPCLQLNVLRGPHGQLAFEPKVVLLWMAIGAQLLQQNDVGRTRQGPAKSAGQVIHDNPGNLQWYYHTHKAAASAQWQRVPRHRSSQQPSARLQDCQRRRSWGATSASVQPRSASLHW